MLDIGDPGQLRRLVVVAAHPGDATFGAGGLIATAHASGLPVYVVLLAAGRSLASTISWTFALQQVGAVESAMKALAPGTPVAFMGAPPGSLAAAQPEIEASMRELVSGEGDVLLASPWRHDGDADHEACGRAAAVAATRSGARLLEFPVDAWRHRHRAWPTLERLPLTPDAQWRKQQAAARLRSVERCSPPPSRALAPAEHFVVGPEVPVNG